MEKKDRIELLLQKYCRSNLFSADTRRFLSSEIIRILESETDVEEMLNPRFNSNLQSKVKEEKPKTEVKIEEKVVEKPKTDKKVEKTSKTKSKTEKKPTTKRVKTMKKTSKKDSPLKGFGKRKKANTLR